MPEPGVAARRRISWETTFNLVFYAPSVRRLHAVLHFNFSASGRERTLVFRSGTAFFRGYFTAFFLAFSSALRSFCACSRAQRSTSIQTVAELAGAELTPRMRD